MDLDLTVSNPGFIYSTAHRYSAVGAYVVRTATFAGLSGHYCRRMILGPSGLGVMERNSLIQFLGQAGLLFIVFVAGLEIDLGRFARYRHHSLTFGSISYIIPQVVGALLAHFVLGFNWLAAILLGSMFGSHTLLAYPVASRLGLTRLTSVMASVGGDYYHRCICALGACNCG